MSVTRHHADWLSLVEASGPFMSLPVLQRVFPQGLEPRDPTQAKALRAAYEEWQDNPAAPGKQRAWVMHVLTAVLGYPVGQIVEGQSMPVGLAVDMAAMGETLRPDFALIGPAGTDTAGQPHLLIANYPAEQSLDKPVIGKHWKATPATRMMELVHGANVPLGLVTNGEHWMLVYAPRGETTGYASWYGALWLDEPITLRAFHSLLGVRRFFGVAADSTLLALLKESASDQQEVTDQLGYQVREAVEVLVQSFDALDKESNRECLKGIQPATVYDAALTVMMRLVFLFSAEERGLLHLGKPLYDDNYAVSTLQEQLQEVADRYGEEVLERRSDAWTRLLATFRAVHGGIQHQDLLMHAYGGSLFDPDRYPFLEGRVAGSHWRSTPAEPLAVNNRVVLHLLNSLQRLRTKVGAGGTAETRRVSFRALGVEQIGHVYEGLLDHTAVRASEVFLGIRGTRKKEPEIALSTLEDLLRQGEDKLLNALKEETDRSLPALRRELNNGRLLDEHKLLVACDHEEALVTRLRRFGGLIRDDSFERPWLVLPGSIFVTEGNARRSTGTHYTPPSLTEPIVRHTLEPLVYVGPAEGLPKKQWKLKSPKEILDLKVCDMAMGSGAFLVQACRYLAERLAEAWENEEKAHPGQVLITPDGNFSEGFPSERLIPAKAAERVAIACRVVADRCLYGVDINPMAVEMAKLSMWLITVDKDRPFSFLDHALKCGDSLLGITSLDQLEHFSLRPDGGRQHTFATLNLKRSAEKAHVKRKRLEEILSDTPQQIAEKAALYGEAEEAIAKVKMLADCLIAFELRGAKGQVYEKLRTAAAEHAEVRLGNSLPELQAFAREQLGNRRTFHWPIEFPEAFLFGGFDAFVGNPPFMGGQKITLNFDQGYRGYLISSVALGQRGSADFCAYFVLRAASLGSNQGTAGLIATNTISEGETRQVGLSQLPKFGVRLIRAISSQAWPGAAALAVAVIWMTKSKWSGQIVLDGQKVKSISPALSSGSSERDVPQRLLENKGKAFKGSSIQGSGFLLTPEEAQGILQQDARYNDVLFPYLGGEDITRRPDGSPSRWVINFFNFTLDEAARYPLCLEIVRQKVKPDREKVAERNTIGQRRAKYWWRYDAQAADLYKHLGKLSHAWVAAQTSKYISIVNQRSDIVFSHMTVVFPTNSHLLFSVLNSNFHSIWIEEFCATLETRLRYIPTDGFETYPFPRDVLTVAYGRGIATAQLPDFARLEMAGQQFEAMRSSLMAAWNTGLTHIYNQFHDRDNTSTEMARLRVLHSEIDHAVAATYGWQDVDLNHDFYETKQGVRFSISEAARREVLDRLLALNHQRHSEEAAAQAAQPSAMSAIRGRKKRDSGGQLVIDL